MPPRNPRSHDDDRLLIEVLRLMTTFGGEVSKLHLKLGRLPDLHQEIQELNGRSETLEKLLRERLPELGKTGKKDKEGFKLLEQLRALISPQYLLIYGLGALFIIVQSLASLAAGMFGIRYDPPQIPGVSSPPRIEAPAHSPEAPESDP